MRVYHSDPRVEDAIARATSQGARLRGERLELVQAAPRSLGIGNFDGVHLGHQEIFRRVQEQAEERGLSASALTFVPHPTRFFRPELAPALIDPLSRRLQLLCSRGLEDLIILPFDGALASMSAEAFVREILTEKLGARFIVVGARFGFGRGREGSVATLQQMGSRCGFEALGLDPICDEQDVPISSSRVRQLVRRGEMPGARALLGRSFALEGPIVTGAGRGRTIGFPTANLAPETCLIPARAVYAARVEVEEQRLEAVVNVGRAPTFVEDGALQVEVHLLDFSADLVGKWMRVHFVQRLRDEMRFANVDELVAAIAKDVATARRLLDDKADDRGEPRCA